MKKDIHPDYMECKVSCACGNSFVTRSTVPEMRLDICSQCHPFYTGKQKLVDTAGRVDQYLRKFEKSRNLREAREKQKASRQQKTAAASAAKSDQGKDEAGEDK